MNFLSAGPVYRRWWFWVGVIVLAFGTLYLKGYLSWKGEQYMYDVQNVVSQAYSTYLKKQSADLEAAYRADTYGGETPEETLRLFVEALEKRDFELASKYFVIENQEENLKRFPEAVQSGGMNAFVNAYRNGEVVPPEGVGSSGIYEIEIFESQEDEVGFGVRLLENEFTSKWKILEL